MKRNKFKIIIVIIIIFIVIALIFGTKKNDENENYVTITEIKSENIESYVDSSGIVLSEKSYEIYSKLSGEVIKLNISEGDIVKEGQILCEIDNELIKNQIIETEIQLEIAKENLVQILSSGTNNYETLYKNAILTKDNMYDEYQNAKKLYEAGVYSKATLQAANDLYIQAKNNYDEMKINFNGENSVSEIKIQELRIKSLENALGNQNNQLNDTLIKSPIDGVITILNTNLLSYINPGTILFIVEDISDLKVESNISQYDIHKIKVGQNVEITAEGVDEIKFDGKISYIGSRANLQVIGQSQEKVIKIEVEINSKDTNLKPNYSVKIKINTDSKENVLTMPYECVYITKNGEKIVYTVENDIVKAHKIERGVEGIFNFEVISKSLKIGDIVILNPTENIKDGMSVVITDETSDETSSDNFRRGF